jgi:hypothetical protein
MKDDGPTRLRGWALDNPPVGVGVPSVERGVQLRWTRE